MGLAVIVLVWVISVTLAILTIGGLGVLFSYSTLLDTRSRLAASEAAYNERLAK